MRAAESTADCNATAGLHGSGLAPMPRKISEEKRHEYEELKTFFVHYVTRILRLPVPLDHPAHPVNSITALELMFGISRALAGLKQAVNDIIENCEDLSPSEISLADASLASAGSITLTEAIRRRSKLYKAILKRGKIRNETEFPVVSAIRSDTALNLPESEISILDLLIVAYEQARI